jgi:hypothetical protein
MAPKENAPPRFSPVALQSLDAMLTGPADPAARTERQGGAGEESSAVIARNEFAGERRRCSGTWRDRAERNPGQAAARREEFRRAIAASVAPASSTSTGAGSASRWPRRWSELAYRALCLFNAPFARVPAGRAPLVNAGVIALALLSVLAWFLTG